MHCAKAFMRSELWKPESWPDRTTLPTLGEILRDQLGARPVGRGDRPLARRRLQADHVVTAGYRSEIVTRALTGHAAAQCCIAAFHVAMHTNVHIFIASGRNNQSPPQGGTEGTLTMIFSEPRCPRPGPHRQAPALQPPRRRKSRACRSATSPTCAPIAAKCSATPISTSTADAPAALSRSTRSSGRDSRIWRDAVSRRPATASG